MPGQGAATAVYDEELTTELAILEGSTVGGVLLDMEKFNGNVDLHVLLQDGIEHSYPLWLLVLGIEAYLGPRSLTKNGTASGECLPGNGIVPGCGHACSLARLFLLSPLKGGKPAGGGPSD